jgi:RND family efflux transporter MFP subunit
VDGNLTRILVKSGDMVKAGQVLMTIDPLKQQATVQQQVGTENQLKATYQYNQAEVERQRKLYDAGVTSRDAYDQAVQAYQNSQGAYNSSVAQTNTQREQLAYYQIRAPFAGVVGDIPVHQGDYVSPTTLLTTVDENAQLEVYIYIPTERAAEVKPGLPVEVLDTAGKTLAKTAISFLSPEVDNGLQSILAKAEVPRTATMLRTEQIVKARITWNSNASPVVPVLAVTRIGGQAFVYAATPRGDGYFAHQVPVTLGDTVGNNYPVLSGLKTGDKVIVSGLQILQEGMPVHPLN